MKSIVLWLTMAAICVIYCADSTYYGIRVAKKCESMLADNVFLAQAVFNEIKTINIGSVSDTQGDWWNIRTIDFTDVKSTNFVHKKDAVKLKSCKMLPTGTMDVLINGEGFVWDVQFNWAYSFLGMKLFTGQGTATLSSDVIELMQSYTDNIPVTNFYVKWKISKFSMTGFMLFSYIENLARILTTDKLFTLLTLRLNLRLKTLNENIIKSYRLMETASNGHPIHVENSIKDGTEGNINDQSYVVLPFNAKIVIPLTEYSRDVTVGTTSAINSMDNTPFDYQVCYSSRLFSEYLDLLFKTDYISANITDPDKLNLPGTMGFYREMMPELGGRYADSEKVRLFCYPERTISVVHFNQPKRMIIIGQCEFYAVSTQEQFLRLTATYNASYTINRKESTVQAELSDVRTHLVESKQRLDISGKIMAMELADKLSALFNNFHIPQDNSFFVDSVRSAKYEFLKFESRDNDVCLLYADKEKF